MTTTLLPFLTGATTATLCLWLLHWLATPKSTAKPGFSQDQRTVASIITRIEHERLSTNHPAAISYQPFVNRRGPDSTARVAVEHDHARSGPIPTHFH
ncbi:hypothetical protein JMUB6875_76670 [Nocardia sp. JMUB6875]|uniref:hypothetical protein n=1 Tax=Nocardia sp. JMUB6875 TaxID=3158170 RepID=UPI0032E6F953